mmetsp:Transcript_3654/g.7632  ORF Transcript_3654/g.7632 Transcript_3654/m.7632 type:complete len:113 (-) Transcript_3654:364-702(-)
MPLQPEYTNQIHGANLIPSARKLQPMCCCPQKPTVQQSPSINIPNFDVSIIEIASYAKLFCCSPCADLTARKVSLTNSLCLMMRGSRGCSRGSPYCSPLFCSSCRSVRNVSM